MSLAGVNFTFLNQPKMNTWPMFQKLAFLEQNCLLGQSSKSLPFLEQNCLFCAPPHA